MPDSLETIQEALRSEDRVKAIAAARQLEEVTGESAIPVLVSCFSNRFWLVRKIASNALVAFGAPALPALQAAADDENDDTRVWSLMTMGKLGFTEAVPVLMQKILSDPSHEVKLAASIALGHLGDSRGIQHLVSRLGHEDFDIRKLSAEGLINVGPRVVPILLSALQTDNEDMVYWTHRVLQHLRLTDLSVILSAFTGDPPEKRVILADILGNYPQEDSIACLIGAFTDPVWTVRKQASLSLVRLGPIVVDHLIGCVEEEQPDRRYWGLRTLGEIHGRGAEALAGFLTHEDKEIRRFATEYLTLTTRNPDHIPLLLERLGDTSLAVRSAALTSLLRFDGRVIEALMVSLNAENQVVAYQVAKGLGSLGSAVEEQVTTALKDENPVTRKWAAVAIGEMDRPDLAGLLIIALGDTDWKVRFAAADALEKLGVRVLDELIQNIQNANPDISYWTMRVLKKIKHEALEPLLQILKTGNEDMRFFTAFALGEMEEKTVVPNLLEALHDGSDWVRKLAMESLIKLGALEELKDMKREALPALRQEIDLQLRKLGIFDVEPYLDGLRSMDQAVVEQSVKELISLGEPARKRLETALEVEPDEEVRMWLIKIIRAIDTGSEFGLGF